MSGGLSKRKLGEMEDEGDDGGGVTEARPLFSAEELRKKMKTPEIFDAMKFYFLRAKGDRDAIVEDFVGDYLREGGSFGELLSALIKVDVKKDSHNVYTIFTAMHLVIDKVIAEFPDNMKALVSNCKQFSAGYLKTVFSYLTPSNVLKFRKTALKLLRALAGVNDYFAHEIVISLDLSQKDCESLTEHFRPDDYFGTRTSFIKLLAALIATKSTQVILKLIDKKVLLNSVFFGMVHDPVGVVVPLLDLLRTHIAKNRNVNKTQKRRIFNTHLMLRLVALYSWNPYAMKLGSSSSSNKHSRHSIKEPDPEDLQKVRESVHALLVLLMTSTKLGLAFHDPTYGTSAEKNCNQLLYTIVQGITQPWKDDLKEELILKTLCSSPDLVGLVFPLYERHVQSPVKFIEVSKFFRKVIRQLHIDASAVSLKACTKITLTVLAPRLLLKGAGCDAVLLTSTDLKLPGAALKTTRTVLEALARFKISVAAAHPDPTGFITAVNQHLVNNAPSCLVLMKLLERCTQSTDIKVFCSVVETFVVYERVCPQLLDNIRFSADAIDTMRESIVRLVDSCTEKNFRARLVIKSVELNLIINPEEWATRGDTGSEMLEQLCQVLVDHVDERCLRNGLVALHRILHHTGLFASAPEELRLLCSWAVGGHWPAGLSFVPPAIALCHNLAPYYSAIAAAEEEAASRDSDHSYHHALDIDDYIQLSKLSSEESCFGATTTCGLYSGLNVSPFLPALLQAVGSTECTQEMVEYIQTFLVHLFHYQVSPKAYTALIRAYSSSSPVISSVLPYMESWSESPSCLDFGPFASSSHEIISTYLLKGDDMIQNPLEKLDQDDPLSVELCFHQCIFTICQLSALSLATLGIVERAADLVEKLLLIVFEIGEREDNKGLSPNGGDLSRILGHPRLLQDFHPVRQSKRTNTTWLTVAVVGVCQPPDVLVRPFTKKLVHELRCAAKNRKQLKYNFGEILKLFPLDDSDIKDLLVDLVNFDSRLLIVEKDSARFSAWFELESHLLKRATESKILIDNQQMTSLCRQLIDLILKTVDVGSFFEIVLGYFNCYSDLSDFFSQDPLNSAAKDLRLELYRSPCWHRGLLERLSFLVGSAIPATILVELPVDRLAVAATDLAGEVVGTRRSTRGSSGLEEHDAERVQKTPIISRLVSRCLEEIILAITLSPAPEWTADLPKVSPNLSSKVCKKFYDQVMEAKKNIVVSPGSLGILERVFDKCNAGDTLVGLAHQWLTDALNAGDEDASELLMDLLIRRAGDVKGVPRSLVLSGRLVRLLLSKGLSEGGSPSCLTVVRLCSSPLANINSIDDSGEENNSLVSTIFELVTSHSRFIPVLLAEDLGCRTKLELARLLFALMKKDKSVMKEDHIEVYLSAYNATLSKTDVTLLQIMHEYESNGIGMLRRECRIWGRVAADHYSLGRRQHSAEVGVAVTSDDFNMGPLDMLRSEMVEATITKFPLGRRLELGDDLYDENSVDWDEFVYDPVFMLAALRVTLEEGGMGHNLIRRIARTGAASLILATLAAEDPMLRNAGYGLLHKFTLLLDSSKHGQFIGHFLEAVRGGIRHAMENCTKKTENTALRLTSVVATFLARSFFVVYDPHHPLYSALVNFILAKPYINLNTVPAFFELFNYKGVDQREHQKWILEVIRDGMRTKSDLQLVLNSFTLKIILDYHSSCLASDETKALIVEIVKRCLTVDDNQRNLLMREYSILAWIGHKSDTIAAIAGDSDEEFLPTLAEHSHFKNLRGHLLEKVARYKQSL